jgi:hypothetical protein
LAAELMIDAEEAVVWVNRDTKEVMVKTHAWGCSVERSRLQGWGDPIGAAYTRWQKMKDQQRVHLMLETAIDLAMQGIPLKQILTEFVEVRQFRALGKQSYPMCRAITKALLGKSYEANTIDFEDLLIHYAPTEYAESSATNKQRASLRMRDNA